MLGRLATGSNRHDNVTSSPSRASWSSAGRPGESSQITATNYYWLGNAHWHRMYTDSDGYVLHAGRYYNVVIQSIVSGRFHNVIRLEKTIIPFSFFMETNNILSSFSIWKYLNVVESPLIQTNKGNKHILIFCSDILLVKSNFFTHNNNLKRGWRKYHVGSKGSRSYFVSKV